MFGLHLEKKNPIHTSNFFSAWSPSKYHKLNAERVTKKIINDIHNVPAIELCAWCAATLLKMHGSDFCFHE